MRYSRSSQTKQKSGVGYPMSQAVTIVGKSQDHDPRNQR